MSDGTGSDEEGAKEAPNTALWQAHARALNAELDAVGFPSLNDDRVKELSGVMHLKKTQTYRVLKGMTSPRLEYLGGLRKLGISIDRIADYGNHSHPETVLVYVGKALLPAVIQKGVDGIECIAALVPREQGYELIDLASGQGVPQGAIPIQAMQFVAKATLAIVEDEANILELLTRQMSEYFRATPFLGGVALLDCLEQKKTFAAYLIDWRLPDMNGEDLVKRLRLNTMAPIFILTGDASASEAIAKALDYANVHHVAKPADALILSKRITTAIRNAA